MTSFASLWIFIPHRMLF